MSVCRPHDILAFEAYLPGNEKRSPATKWVSQSLPICRHNQPNHPVSRYRIPETAAWRARAKCGGRQSEGAHTIANHGSPHTCVVLLINSSCPVGEARRDLEPGSGLNCPRSNFYL